MLGRLPQQLFRGISFGNSCFFPPKISVGNLRPTNHADFRSKATGVARTVSPMSVRSRAPQQRHNQAQAECKFANDPCLFPLSHSELGGAVSVAVSPSGMDVYVASSNPGALAHFCVNDNSGELESVAWDGNETPTDLNLDGASSVSGTSMRACLSSGKQLRWLALTYRHGSSKDIICVPPEMPQSVPLHQFDGSCRTAAPPVSNRKEMRGSEKVWRCVFIARQRPHARKRQTFPYIGTNEMFMHSGDCEPG